MYRNPVGSLCFSQHPLANTPRPAALAFQLLARVFGEQAFVPLSLTGLTDAVTTMVFQRTNNERIVVVWNNTRERRRHTIRAIGAGATQYHLTGETSQLPAIGGIYTLELEAADDFSFPDLESTRSSAIGGEPMILVESPSQ